MKKLLKPIAISLIASGSLLSITGIVLMSVSTNYQYSNNKQVTTSQNLRHILGSRYEQSLANYSYNVTFNCGKDNYKNDIDIFIINKHDQKVTPQDLDKLYPNTYIPDVIKNAENIHSGFLNCRLLLVKMAIHAVHVAAVID